MRLKKMRTQVAGFSFLLFFSNQGLLAQEQLKVEVGDFSVLSLALDKSKGIDKGYSCADKSSSSSVIEDCLVERGKNSEKEYQFNKSVQVPNVEAKTSTKLDWKYLSSKAIKKQSDLNSLIAKTLQYNLFEPDFFTQFDSMVQQSFHLKSSRKTVSRLLEFTPFSYDSNQTLTAVRRRLVKKTGTTSAKGKVAVPLTVRSAFAMELGEHYRLPYHGVLSMDVDNTFAGKTLASESELTKLMTASRELNIGPELVGTFVRKGSYIIDIMRLKKSDVLVRVSFGHQSRASGELGVGISEGVAMAFLPFARPERILQFAEPLARKAGYKGPWFFDRLTDPEFVTRTMELGEAASEDAAEFTSGELGEVFSRVTEDPLRAQSQGAIATLQKTNKKFHQGVILAGRYHRFMDTLKRSYEVSSAFRIEKSKAEAIGMERTFVFDLSKAKAQKAYVALVNGQAFWGLTDKAFDTQVFSRSKLSKRVHASTMLADKLASMRSFDDSLGVQLLEDRSFDEESGEIDMQLSGLGIKSFAHQKISSLRFDLTDKTKGGSYRKYGLWVESWELRNGFDLMLFREKSIAASGVIFQSLEELDNSSAALENSDEDQAFLAGLWYSWEEKRDRHARFAPLATDPDLFTKALGPVLGELTDVDSKKPTELSKSLRLIVKLWIKGEAIDAIRKAAEKDRLLYWRSMAKVSDTFDNTFGLLYRTHAIAALKKWPESIEPFCDVISKHWGTAYCSSFKRLFDDLTAANDSKAFVRVVQEWSRMALFTNTIYSRLMAQFMIEVLRQVDENWRDTIFLSAIEEREYLNGKKSQVDYSKTTSPIFQKLEPYLQ